MATISKFLYITTWTPIFLSVQNNSHGLVEHAGNEPIKILQLVPSLPKAHYLEENVTDYLFRNGLLVEHLLLAVFQP